MSMALSTAKSRVVQVPIRCLDEDMQETVIIRFTRLPEDGVCPQTNSRYPESLAGTDGRCCESANRLRRTVILVPTYCVGTSSMVLLPEFRAAGLENKMHNRRLELVMAGE